MLATNLQYDFEKSLDRIDEILDGADAGYEDKPSIPVRDLLTYSNGYYVNACVLYIDIRGSKRLASAHTRPVLAKIYRAYISEMIAVLRDNSKVSEVYIEGDGVWAVFDTPTTSDIDGVLATAGKVSSLNEVLNVKLRKKKYSEIRIGIGIDYGESLYLKAGHKGSGINEVVWVGKVVGQAADLCANANRFFTKRIQASESFRNGLSKENRKFLTRSLGSEAYEGDVVDHEMNEWKKSNGRSENIFGLGN